MWKRRHNSTLKLTRQALILHNQRCWASLISAPSANNPIANRELSFDLMRTTMNRMAEVGCLQFEHAPYDAQPFCVTQADVVSGETGIDIARIEARPFEAREFGVEYPHFTLLVQNELELLFGAAGLYQQGFTVTTTIDSALQDHAQQALINRVNALGGNGVETGTVHGHRPNDLYYLGDGG